MKRYIVFAGDQYYPLGGPDDILGVYPDLATAVFHMANSGRDWACVWDCEREAVVSETGQKGFPQQT